MDFDDLNTLPPWRDDYFDDEEGEEWKTKEAKEASKALYDKWRELYTLILAFAENLTNGAQEGKAKTHEQLTQQLIYENAMIIGAKIISGSGVRMYLLQMENAAIIRTSARQLMEQVGFAVLMDFTNENYKKVIEEGMNEFRLLFKTWVATFQKDEVEDDWGLFT